MSSVTVTTQVTSDASSKTLDVKDHGAPIGVPQETDATNLVWQLTGSAAQGSFNAIDLTNEDSGFYWIDTPPAGIFSTPVLSANGNQITMLSRSVLNHELSLAKMLIETRGKVSDAEMSAIREAGFRDSEIVEIAALTAQFLLTNFVNNVAQTEIDFPAIEAERHATRASWMGAAAMTRFENEGD